MDIASQRQPHLKDHSEDDDTPLVSIMKGIFKNKVIEELARIKLRGMIESISDNTKDKQ